jgi:hypothetical protein
MIHKPKADATTKGEASRKFVNAMKRILSVPKSEMERREAKYQQERAVKKALRKSKLSALLVFFLWWFSIHSVLADPDERAQMLKAGILRKLVTDGWQLVQETHSLLVVERPAEGSFAFMAQAFMTGANGTKPVIRWSATITPTNDHDTYCYFVGTVNSQNAFGQMKSWPLKNRKDTAYILGVLKTASDGLPAKYKFVP